MKSAGGIGDESIDESRQEEGRHRKTKRLFIHPGGTNGNGEGSNQAGIADDRADGIAVGDAAVVGNGSLGRNHNLRQGGADGDNGCAD